MVAAEEAVLTWRGEEGTLVDVLVTAMAPEANEEVLEEDKEKTL